MSSIKNTFIFLYIFIQICNYMPCWCLQNSINACKPRPIADLPDLPELFFIRAGAKLLTLEHKIHSEEILLHGQFDKGHFTLLENILAYGFSQQFGLALYVPWISKNINGTKSSGFGDVFVATQWHFFYQEPNRASFLVGVGFPTGSTSKIPTLGSGTYSGFFELAEAHSSDYWRVSSFFRTHIFPHHKGEKIGARFSYQFVAGPKIPLKNGSKIHALCELNCIYDAKSKECGKTLFDSGVTVVTVGPFIAYEKGNIIIEENIQLPIAQNFSENNLKIDWFSIFTFKIIF